MIAFMRLYDECLSVGNKNLYYMKNIEIHEIMGIMMDV